MCTKDWKGRKYGRVVLHSSQWDSITQTKEKRMESKSTLRLKIPDCSSRGEKDSSIETTGFTRRVWVPLDKKKRDSPSHRDLCIRLEEESHFVFTEENEWVRIARNWIRVKRSGLTRMTWLWIRSASTRVQVKEIRFSYGKRGIRTLGKEDYIAIPMLRLKPLGHLSS